MRNAQTYEELVAAALEAPFSGWRFDYLEGRVRNCELPWSYEELARGQVTAATRLLDLDTGGGETLVDVLQDRRPRHAVATEAWPPNIPVARARLEPLGITVREAVAGARLPAADGEFDLVLNRHGGCSSTELHRVLAAGGTYLTQQVGRDNDLELNAALGGPPPTYGEAGTLAHSVEELRRAGFRITRSDEVLAEFAFYDIGAVVFHLSAVSWQIPGFDVVTYDAPLRALDARIREEGEFTVRHHRYLISAVRL
jgi:SAM-dependent methyltransferase